MEEFEDMAAISEMLEQARLFGLEVEVVASLANILMSGETDIERACYSALIEWDAA